MFVVTLPASASHDPKAFVRRAKRAGADILEVRTDLTPNMKPFSSAVPILLSLRGSDRSLLGQLDAKYVDLDLLDVSSCSFPLPKGVKLVLSYHHHESTPSLKDLQKIVQKMYSYKPWMIKIATTIVHYNDISVLYDLQSFMNKKSIQSTVLGMGPKSHLLRLLSPLRNSWTYTYVHGDASVAPGQLPLSMYSLTRGRKTPKIFGILGGPHITSSLSPVIHNALFQRHKIDALYSCFPSEDFRSTLKVLKKLGVKGLSVTAPFKHEAFAISAELETAAKKLGVVNTLIYSREQWKGYITDSFGISEGYPALISVKNVAILGAGGAVPSVILAVRTRSPKALITVFARDTKKAAISLNTFGVSIESLDKAAESKADAVICAISEDTKIPLPSPESKWSIAIDLRYGKETTFMRDADTKKFRVSDGTSMLIHQALKQFRHFTGKNPRKDEAEYLLKVLRPFLSSR